MPEPLLPTVVRTLNEPTRVHPDPEMEAIRLELKKDWWGARDWFDKSYIPASELLQDVETEENAIHLLQRVMRDPAMARNFVNMAGLAMRQCWYKVTASREGTRKEKSNGN